jgi:branched-subunit amino acid ABC-type transport system permease component
MGGTNIGGITGTAGSTAGAIAGGSIGGVALVVAQAVTLSSSRIAYAFFFMASIPWLEIKESGSSYFLPQA